MRRITEVQHRGRKREKKVEQQEGETKRRIWEEVECRSEGERGRGCKCFNGTINIIFVNNYLKQYL